MTAQKRNNKTTIIKCNYIINWSIMDKTFIRDQLSIKHNLTNVLVISYLSRFGNKSQINVVAKRLFFLISFLYIKSSSFNLLSPAPLNLKFENLIKTT